MSKKLHGSEDEENPEGVKDVRSVNLTKIGNSSKSNHKQDVPNKAKFQGIHQQFGHSPTVPNIVKANKAIFKVGHMTDAQIDAGFADLDACPGCIAGGATRKRTKKHKQARDHVFTKSRKSLGAFEEFAADSAGPLSVKTKMGGYRYFLVFRDKKTRYGHVEFYRNFGDQREAFKKGILYLRTLRSFDHKKGKFELTSCN